jgi:hypothetical protein
VKVVSVDAAWSKPWAFALFIDERLVYYDRVKDLIGIPDKDIDYVVTENPYPGGKIETYSYKGRSESFRTLCFAVGMVMQFAKSIGAVYQLVRPVDWKSFYQLTKKTPEPIKDTIRTQLTGVQGDGDLQDAILIGRYFVEHVYVRMET